MSKFITDGNQLATGFNVPEDHMYHKGLTKREEFAKSALQGLLSHELEMDGMTMDELVEIYADRSVALADALIKSLNKNNSVD